ncbi:MAG: TauD/TfdA family dioxygenase [Crocosphaera sp.]|nr:TauD/TfdA family dioxygenase [Crocosphaera sp.]
MSNTLETVIDKSDKILKRQGKIAIAGTEINITLTVDEQGKILDINWGEPDSSSQYTVEWLVNEHSQSVTNYGIRVGYELIRDEFKIVDLKIMPDSLVIVLSNDTEVAFTYESLLQNSNKKISKALGHCIPPSSSAVESSLSVVLGSDESIPTFDYAEIIDNLSLRAKYLHTVRKYGIALVTGTPVDPVDPFDKKPIHKLCNITGGLQVSHYGDASFNRIDVRIENEDDTYQSLTGEEIVAEYQHPASSNAILHSHIDYSFWDATPGIALLECVEYEKIKSRGETVFFDGIQVAQEFKALYPQSFKTLCELPVVFSTDRRPNPENPAYYRSLKPIFSFNYYGELEEIRFEQTNYHLPNLEPQDTKRMLTALSDFKHFCNSIEEKGEMGHAVYWEPGHTVVWNNRRMLHYRPAYIPAPDAKRSQILAYANYLDFLSLCATIGGNSV